MSSIEKLLVRGIRSFSPYDENVIEFYTPLTIIVGHNGAGKTTIIECLKYASTGDLPPNSKGGAFVHDPKVSRELEIKGQIKLKFRNVKGQTMVCTRSMQSMQKKAKLEQKTLESVLVTTDPATGEQVSISSRCAEMDAEIPLQLGVSRAVLENVLFCHQEESFWPLSEPSILKKKFDDIFAATRYTKALDTLKSLKKDYTAELKLEQQKLDFLKADRDKMAKLQLEIEKNMQRREEGLQKIDAIDAQMGTIKEAIERLTADLRKLSDLQGEIERLQHEVAVNHQSRQDLLQGLRVMEETDAQLTELLDQLSRCTASDENTLSDMLKTKAEIEARISDVSHLFSQKSTEAGIMEAELTRVEERKQVRQELINTLAPLLQVSSLAGNQAMLDTFADKITDKRRLLEALVQEAKDAEQMHNQRIHSATLKLSSANETKRIKRKGIEEAQRKLGNIVDQMAELSSAKDQIGDMQIRLMEEEALLNQSKRFFEAADYEGRAMALGQKREDIDQQIRDLQSKAATISRFSDKRARLELRRNEYVKKGEAADKIFADVRPDLEASLGCPLSASDAEKEADRIWRAKERQWRALQERYDKAKQACSLAKSKCEHASQLHAKKQRELLEKTRRVEAACGTEDFGMCMEESERELDKITNELAESLSSKSTYEAFHAAFERNHACALCDRRFDTRVDEELFSRKLVKFIESLPGRTASLQEQKRVLESKVSQLKSLRSTSDDVDRLRLVELPELEIELKAVAEEQERLQLSFDDISAEASNASLEEKKYLALKRRCEELGRLLRETSLLKGDVDSIESEMRSFGAEIDAGMLQSSLAELQKDRERIQTDIELLNRETKLKLGEVQAREGRFRDLKEQIMKIQLKQSEVVMMEQSKRELEASIADLNAEIALLETAIAEATEELRGAQEQRAEDALFYSDREHRARQELAEIEQVHRDLGSINAEIARIEATANTGLLATLASQKRELSLTLGDLQTKLDQTVEQIAVFSKASSEAMVQERTIRDNLKCRELALRIHGLEDDIAELQRTLGSFDRTAASSQLQRQELRHSELLGERSGLYGELRQLQDQSERFSLELSTEYRCTEQEYREQFIRCNATLTAVEDLEKYAKALDQAIMKFHSYKMSEVNRIIREIWTGTYQGADIDTIEIRADHEGAAAGGRSYNYRVVMLKGETELDMRGRSSAGQRVLASLVIRLALAETFGQHCGVLALDEPTTNLDRDNIESLANSLAEIIKMRSSQGNFQLIIITHDEEFVDLLGRHECADYYWRVFKDENQYSSIERQSFQGV